MINQEISDILKRGNEEQINQIIYDLIEQNRPVAEYTKQRYNEYAGRVNIMERTFEDTTKINNRLANDFRGDIVDSITGYMYGKPIRWEYTPNKKRTQHEQEKVRETIRRYQRNNNLSELDSTTGEDASIMGRAYWLMYIDQEGQERIMRLRPWEVITVEDATVENVTHGMIYYEVKELKNGIEAGYLKAEFYDETNITFLVQEPGGRFIKDPAYKINPVPHLFDGVPIIQIKNNNLMYSDFEKVQSLIDAYDRTLSDVQNELEEFRLAYLAFFGSEPTAESIKAARRTGAFGMDSEDDVRFITKNLSIEAVKDHKATLEKNIYLFSKTVNMSDEKFSGGQQSGDSRRWKLLSMENRAISKEAKYRKALQRQLQLLISSWKKKGIKLDELEIEFIFTRNVPEERIYLAEIAQKLNGIASEETVLSFIPGVEDPLRELERKRSEKKEAGTQKPPIK